MTEDRYGISIVWPEFTVEDIIGEGTFGVVYKVYKESFGIRYYSAVKVVPIPKEQSDIESYRADGMDDQSIEAYCEELVKRLSKEINFMESLKAVPNIVTIDDFTVRKQAEGPGWIVYIRMELLTNLNKYRERYGLDTAGVVKLGIDISRGLEYCSRRNIIHRDIKPANIFVNNFGDFKLGDFGISREGDMTNVRSRQGSPPYMAPEVVRQETYNSTIDIYSLGIVLYRLMNDNRLPFYPPANRPVGYEDSQAANEKRLSGLPMPAPAHADRELTRIILKACSYRSQDRYQNAAELREALEEYQKNGLSQKAGKGNESGRWQPQSGAAQNGAQQPYAPFAGGNAYLGQAGYQMQGEAGDGTVAAPEASYSYSGGHTPSSGSYNRQPQSGNSYAQQGYAGQQGTGSNSYMRPGTGSNSYSHPGTGSSSYGQAGTGSNSYSQPGTGSFNGQHQPGNSYSQPGTGDPYRKPQEKKADKGRKIGIPVAVVLLVAAGIIFAVLGVKAVQDKKSDSLQQAPSGTSDQVVMAQRESARESEESRKESESESQKASEVESRKISEEESRKMSEEESQKTSEEESQKASEEESQKTSEEESQKASEEESQKTSEAESQKASEQESESQKTSEEESQKASEAESQKTSEEESQKASEAESQKTTEAESQQTAEAAAQQASEAESQKTSEAESQRASESESQQASEAESQKASESESQQASEAEAQAAVETAPLKYLVTKDTHLYSASNYDSENVDITVPVWSVISGNDQSGEENGFLSVDGPVGTWTGWIPRDRLAPYTEFVTCFEQISKETLDDMESAAKDKIAAYCQEQGIDADFTLYGYEMRYRQDQSETQEDNNDLALLFAAGDRYLPVIFRNLQVTELGAVSLDGDLLGKVGIVSYDDKNVLFYDEAGFGDRMLTTDSSDDLTAYSNLMAEPKEQYITLTTADPVDGQDYYDSLDYWENTPFDIWTGSVKEQNS